MRVILYIKYKVVFTGYQTEEEILQRIEGREVVTFLDKEDPEKFISYAKGRGITVVAETWLGIPGKQLHIKEEGVTI